MQCRSALSRLTAPRQLLVEVHIADLRSGCGQGQRQAEQDTHCAPLQRKRLARMRPHRTARPAGGPSALASATSASVSLWEQTRSAGGSLEALLALAHSAWAGKGRRSNALQAALLGFQNSKCSLLSCVPPPRNMFGCDNQSSPHDQPYVQLPKQRQRAHLGFKAPHSYRTAPPLRELPPNAEARVKWPGWFKLIST